MNFCKEVMQYCDIFFQKASSRFKELNSTSSIFEEITEIEKEIKAYVIQYKPRLISHIKN